MKPRTRISAATASPHRVPLCDGDLVLPPITLRELPPGGVVGFFMGIISLRFITPVGTVAVFLHDLGADDVAKILEVQRRQAEVQLGASYARGSQWWGGRRG